MRLNIGEAKNYIGCMIKVFTITDRRIAARLINVNEIYILIENSNGYRSKIAKDEIESLFTMRNQGGV
jgi:hypothetical protein